jgi:phosphoribosyl-AMP cyclohydrolase / phosphoribosyl-ATP pyrophosphohydrolase
MIRDNLNPDFTKGLIPAIIQDFDTKNVLMLGYMNQQAFDKSIEEKRVTFYSRSKQRLWTKGETSGNYLTIKSIVLDCDNDTILIKAEPSGPICHKGTDTCFDNDNKSTDLGFLEATIQDRIANPKADSYTTSLLESGINKVAQKVGEEAVELVIESKDDNDDLFLNEAADLMYHYLVLLAAKDFELNDVINVLKSRRT